MPKEKEDIQVSANNPCPFLRALVQHELLNDDVAAIGEVTNTIVKVASTGEGNPEVNSLAIRAIALIANGLGPIAIARSGFSGVRLDALRNGPLDKKGGGSGILDAHALINEAELERLTEFASDKIAADGTAEQGLDEAELTKMMDANFARSEGSRRSIDRKLMNGEWPVLLRVIGKEGKDGRYLSIAEIRDLFIDRTLPERMMKKFK